MQCPEFQQHIDDRLDDQLAEELRTDMDAHLENCASCRDSMLAAQAMREMLRDMPVTEPSPGFAARALRQAAKANSAADIRPRRLAFAAGATAVLVAGIVLWLGTGVQHPQGETGLASQPEPADQPKLASQPEAADQPKLASQPEPADQSKPADQPKLAEVNLHTREIHQIRLAFNAATDISKVHLTLEFPENVELANYSGRKRIAWYTKLYKGDNVLTLPLSGLKSSNGILIARVNTGKSSSEIRINLNVQESGIATINFGRIAA